MLLSGRNCGSASLPRPITRRWLDLAARLLSRDSQSVPPTCVFGENRSDSSATASSPKSQEIPYIDSLCRAKAICGGWDEAISFACLASGSAGRFEPGSLGSVPTASGTAFGGAGLRSFLGGLLAVALALAVVIKALPSLISAESFRKVDTSDAESPSAGSLHKGSMVGGSGTERTVSTLRRVLLESLPSSASFSRLRPACCLRSRSRRPSRTCLWCRSSHTAARADSCEGY